MEPLLKTLNLLKIEDIIKQTNWNYIVDTNKMNFQNILNQCSLNQMISLLYINYQQTQALDGYV